MELNHSDETNDVMHESVCTAWDLNSFSPLVFVMLHLFYARQHPWVFFFFRLFCLYNVNISVNCDHHFSRDVSVCLSPPADIKTWCHPMITTTGRSHSFSDVLTDRPVEGQPLPESFPQT